MKSDIELVAEFMDIYVIGSESKVYYECDEDGYVDYVSDPIIYSPDSDWNQLMDVVEKIQLIKNKWEDYYRVIIGRKWCQIDQGENTYGVDISVYKNEKDTITATFKVCVEFIKEYNKIKE